MMKKSISIEDKEHFELCTRVRKSKNKTMAVTVGKHLNNIYVPVEYICLSEFKTYDIFKSNQKKLRIVFCKTKEGGRKLRNIKYGPSCRHTIFCKNILIDLGITEAGRYTCQATKTSVTIDFNKKID